MLPRVNYLLLMLAVYFEKGMEAIQIQLVDQTHTWPPKFFCKPCVFKDEYSLKALSFKPQIDFFTIIASAQTKPQ